MKKYIDKDTVIAKIDKLIKENELYLDDNAPDTIRCQKTNNYSLLNDLRHYIVSLEEVKEVDVESELNKLDSAVIDLNIPRTLIVYENKLYESDWIPRGCKDKCKNCPINSQCASEDLSLCEQYGLNPNDMHIVKELT